MRVALYCRVSTEQQLENYSIDLQKERITAYCVSRGWNKISEYIDGGYSGSNINRPMLTKLQNDINQNKIDVVIVYRLDRLSRSQRDTLYLIEEVFLPKNVEFISISETIDTSTPFGRAMIGILSVFAQLERETITERLRSGRYKMVKEEGLWAGGADASPYGYTRLNRGVLVTNNEEKEHIIKIYTEYLKLKSITKVQMKLKSEGYPVLKHNRVHNILNSRLYLGEVSFAGEWFNAAHEAFITEEMFNEAQKIREKYRGRNFGKIKNTYLTNKLKCAKCGEPYVSQQKTDVLADGSKVKYYYFTCRRRRLPVQYDSKCMNKIWKRDDIETLIFDSITALNNQEIPKQEKKKKPNFKKMIQDIDGRINKLLDLYLDGTIEKTKLDAKVNELNKDKETLIVQQIENENESDNKASELIKAVIPDMYNMPNDEKTAIIDILIDTIYIDEDSLEIVWNF